MESWIPVIKSGSLWILAWAVLPLGLAFAGQRPQPGSIRGTVYDKDFDVPLAGALVSIVETGAEVKTTDQGLFVFPQVAPGAYTLVFSKSGYVRQVKPGVVVTAGQLTDVDASLAGDFVDLEEFVVQDVLQLGAGSEASLLQLRFESPALLDSISSDLMGRAGASDAASALRLVAGASVQDGKSAVIRGLPDRYVSSQVNGMRLPTADEDKRAVELDQFPSPVIESIQISKTFTPDQQGDASGGAVNVRLKGIPDKTTFQFKAQLGRNSQVRGVEDFLTYEGGGVTTWGEDDTRRIQTENLGGNWEGATGISREQAPEDFKWSWAAGGKHELDNGITIGGFASFFYERDSSFYDDGVDDSYWVETSGGPMVPQKSQMTAGNEFHTSLFDVERGTETVQWGSLSTFGIESENHSLGLTWLYSHIAEDTATLAEDTRGKELFFPGYNPNNPMGPGNEPNNLNLAPYVRTETLDYTERTTGTIQLAGTHVLPVEGFELGKAFTFGAPELDWTLADSFAELDQPDKRQFGSVWLPESYHPGVPGILPPYTTPPTHYPFKPAANFKQGNLQRIFKSIEEDSQQYTLNLELPFEQWGGQEGYVKAGVFRDKVDRRFDQDTFSNFDDAGASYIGRWKRFWSKVFGSENHPITESLRDVDYDGEQEISAWYTMLDLPLAENLNVIGGARFESTKIGIVNDPEAEATWFPPGAEAETELIPGDADVAFEQDDVLPSVGLVYEPIESLTLRASYSETVARQTFKELTPILQQEFLGGPTFIGNPELQMSSLENYDLRLDWVPYDGGLLSVSWFHKDITDPIEYVQRVETFTFTTARNYPEGRLGGYELEVRQALGHFVDSLDGLSVGANATFIDSQVTLPDDEVAAFAAPSLQVPIETRDATGAPEHLYNLYMTYDLAPTDTQVALFYTVQGDTLVAGAAESQGNFVPSVYAKEYDTLNLSLSQGIGEHFKLQFQVKNLTNPKIEEVYRSEFIGGDVTKTSYTAGIDYSIALSARFSF